MAAALCSLGSCGLQVRRELQAKQEELEVNLDAVAGAIGASPIGAASKNLADTREALTGEVAAAVGAVGQSADKVQSAVDSSGVLDVLGSAARTTAGAARATGAAAGRAAAASRRRAAERAVAQAQAQAAGKLGAAQARGAGVAGS